MSKTVAQIIPKRFNVREAAAELGCSTDTLYTWVKQQRISHYRLGGRILFSPSHLESVLQDAERPARFPTAA